MSKYRLYSDFRDYYDYRFDLEGECFERFSYAGLSRTAILNFLNSIELENHCPPPKFGKPEDLTSREVIVYLDENAHRGEGKVKLSRLHALTDYPNHLCAEYHRSALCESQRFLFIGDIFCVLRYQSDDEWRSNCGNVNIYLEQFTRESVKGRDQLAPLCAIDYILPIEGGKYAIDYNIAPQVGGTGIEKFLKPLEVVQSIKQVLERQETMKR